MAKVKYIRRGLESSAQKYTPQDFNTTNLATGSGGLIGVNLLGVQDVPKTNSLSEQITISEMNREKQSPAKVQQAVSVKQAVQAEAKKAATVKRPKSPAREPQPMSLTTWANIGNDPAAYPAYVQALNTAKGK